MHPNLTPPDAGSDFDAEAVDNCLMTIDDVAKNASETICQ